MSKWNLLERLISWAENTSSLSTIFFRNADGSAPKTAAPKAIVNHNSAPIRPDFHTLSARALYNAFRPFIGLRDISDSAQTPLSNTLSDIITFINDIHYPDNEWENAKLDYLKESLCAIRDLTEDLPMDGHVEIPTDTLEKLHAGLSGFDQICNNIKALDHDDFVTHKLYALGQSLKSMLVSRQIGPAFISGDKLPPIKLPPSAEIIYLSR